MNLKKYLPFFLTTVLLASLVGGYVVLKGPVIAKLNDWKLLPQPERFTELYFEHHLDLPNTLKPNEQKDINFTVHNLEYQDMTYEYTVRAISTSSAVLLDKNSFLLKENEFRTVTVPVIIPEMMYRTKVIVTLENLHQSIHFWVDPPPTPIPTLTL